MTSSITSDAIHRLAKDAGFELVGVCSATEPFAGLGFYRSWLARGNHAGMTYLVQHAELKANLESVLPGVRSAIVVGANYAQPNPPTPGMPRIARYALGRDYHRVMRKRLARVAKELAALLPKARFRACVDSAPVFERELASRAGLGWFGKNTMLINSHRGSWFLIGVLLTDADLPPDRPSEGGCGTCQSCIDACPTGAIVQMADRWSVDARKCISYWTIEDPMGRPSELNTAEWNFGCDICQEVCPFNSPREHQPLRARDTRDPDFLPKGPEPSLVVIQNFSEGQWDTWTSGRAIRRAGFAGWRRNVMAPDDETQP